MEKIGDSNTFCILSKEDGLLKMLMGKFNLK